MLFLKLDYIKFNSQDHYNWPNPTILTFQDVINSKLFDTLYCGPVMMTNYKLTVVMRQS